MGSRDEKVEGDPIADETDGTMMPARHAQQVFRGRTELDLRDSVPDWRAQIGEFAACGDGLCIGRGSTDAVARDYTPETQDRFTGDTIRFVEVSVEWEQ